MAKPQIPDHTPDANIAFLYVIGADTGAVKVGFTVNPQARLRQLNNGSGTRLKVHHLVPVAWVTRIFAERYAHSLLWTRRVHGEWFNVTAEQALSAIKLADKGVRAGRLPPGLSANAVKGESADSGGTPFGLVSLTPQRAIAAKRYERLIIEATRPTFCPSIRADAQRKLSEIHDAVEAEIGRVGVTLLTRVIGVGECISSLPGSARQYHMMRDYVFRALDDVFRLTQA